MTIAIDLRKGWCPGALRPMASGDGLLLRVKPRDGTLSIASLGVIAEVAARFGSGEIDLTNRANIQIRGLSEASYADALSALDQAGLIDENARVEAVRNIVVDPLSGLDPERLHVRDLAAKLGAAIGETSAFGDLPPKFAFSFSGVGEPKVGGRPADVMIAKGDPLAIWLDGDTEASAVIASVELISAIERLVGTFLRLRAETANINRMHDAVARLGSAAIFAASGLVPVKNAMGEKTERPPIGSLAHQGNVFAVGVGLPFGRIRAAELFELCDTAAKANVRSIQAGPQRLLVFAVDRSYLLLQTAQRLGLIVGANDPRLIIDVCPGKPACANATTETRHDAQNLAESFPNIAKLKSVHVSGCEKGCAHQGKAALTIVAKNGRYDIVCSGAPVDQPSVFAVEPKNLAAAAAKIVSNR